MRRRLLQPEGLACYKQKRKQGLRPSAATVVAALKECGISRDVENGKRIHGDVLANGDWCNVFVANTLVDMYAKCGSMPDARQVFESMAHPSLVSWNCIIMGYAQNGEGDSALQLFERMQAATTAPPSRVTLLAALRACGSMAEESGSRDKWLERCRMLHRQADAIGKLDMVVASSIANVYVKCGSIQDARSTFDKMISRDVISWTTIIRGYVEAEEGVEALVLFSQMQLEGLVPDAETFVAALQACASSRCATRGRAIHFQATAAAAAANQGSAENGVLSGALVDMLAKCGLLEEASEELGLMPEPDVVAWTSLLTACVQCGNARMALRLYHSYSTRCEPNAATYIAALQACASARETAQGRSVHWQAAQSGHLSADAHLASTVVDMYAKCGSVDEARRAFEGLHSPTVPAWTSLIMGYAEAGEGAEALDLYDRMQQEGYAANAITLLAVLKAGGDCKAIHSDAARAGLLDSQSFLANALLDAYARDGNMAEAAGLFQGMANPDWAALITGYARAGENELALRVYKRCPVQDASTCVAALKACGGLAALEQARQVHFSISQQGLHRDVQIANSMVDCYGKCGSMLHAREAFDAVLTRSLATWGALIAGYSRQADAQQALCCLEEMQRLDECLQPDDGLLLAILTACSHAGCAHEARQCFEEMTSKFCVTPRIQHFTCVIDLHGRLGRLDDALAMLRSMPFQADAVVWTSLLGASRKWSNASVGRLAFECLLALGNAEVTGSASLVMSYIYAKSGMWLQTGRSMQEQCSWTDVHGNVHLFSV